MKPTVDLRLEYEGMNTAYIRSQDSSPKSINRLVAFPSAGKDFLPFPTRGMKAR
jgi:hypothetical protein